jgi:dTDP-4-dehydrorhamnose reductase
VKCAVLGAAGQLGRELLQRLGTDATALTRAEADLTRPGAARAALAALRPEVVFNCAAHNLVDRAESEPQAAFAVNARAPRELALACRDLGCALVHFSTDYVFGRDEGRRTPYAESDAPAPVNVYGRSKWLGEQFVRALCLRHFIVRTCGLYGVWGSGGKGGNFVETMLRLAAQGKPLRVVADQVCTPSYAADVADAALALARTGRCGLYHVRSGGACSWYEFARAVFELAGVQADLTPIPSREYAAAARRPAYSVLGMGAYEALGLPRLRPWREALSAYLAERTRRTRGVNSSPAVPAGPSA